MTILFLAHRMAQGFGVAVVLAELSRRLRAAGHRVVVGCIERDEFFSDLDIRLTMPTATAVRVLAEDVAATLVIAHTSPFFELLPALPPPYVRVVWEHGDPEPSLFGQDCDERQAIADHKRLHVYPHVDHVIAISHFIARDIGWPQATVLYNGCDHVEDRGSKDAGVVASGAGPVRVGTLMRLGKGEAFYKGGDLFLSLMDQAREAGLDARFAIMGRGTEEDAAPFLAQGIEVRLNASDAERAQFLRTLDVFVSLSLWEGFNLPVVEAQALGTPALTLDTGAHPEVTPLCLPSLEDILVLVRAYAADRTVLAEHAGLAYAMVRRRFSWDQAVQEFLALPLARKAEPEAPVAAAVPARSGYFWRTGGIFLALFLAGRFLWRHLWSILPESLHPIRVALSRRAALVVICLRSEGLPATIRRILRRLGKGRL
ncbi:MAG: glycosyltransferase family 4 protein [Rhodospirillales bacterium]|nr:glycosyltransferase family 4 protein [Rhodospirillales bacterium]